MRDDLINAMSNVGAELAHVVVVDSEKMEVYIHVPEFEDGMRFLKWAEEKLLGAAFEQKMEAFPVLRTLTNPVKTLTPSGDHNA
jgi:hypothetical protein